jgi:di/tripeptidase
MMRLPRVRFTVRRMMIAVAVVAVLIACSFQAVRLHRNYQHYSWRVEFHTTMEQGDLTLASSLNNLADVLSSGASRLAGRGFGEEMGQRAKKHFREAERRRVSAKYHAQMKAKYEAAARRPWLDVEPDPPPPELLLAAGTPSTTQPRSWVTSWGLSTPYQG